MPTMDDLYTALRNADAAGDTEAAQRLAAHIKATQAIATPKPAPEPSMLSSIGQGAGNLLAGSVRGAGSIGATIMWPIDKLTDVIKGDRGPSLSGLITGQQPLSRNEERRADMDAALRNLGAETDSLTYKGGKLAGEIAGTAGAGGLAVGGLKSAPFVAKYAPQLVDVIGGGLADTRLATMAPNLLRAIETGGFSAGNAAKGFLPQAAKMGTRVVGGAINGGLSAGLVDPNEAGTGALIGGALPPAAKLIGAAGRKVGSMVSGGPVKDAVVDLAKRAQELGIDIPVDRIANSKPLNAVAAGLNYVPFSGRAATEAKMQSQLNRALSRTFGQDSDNVTQALRSAHSTLGNEFDTVLRSNTVKVDSQFLNELADAEATAARELGQDGAGIISKQIDEIMNKGASGQIDGQAAYNIKKTLDRIGKRSTPEAFYAGDLRRSLMGALDRSMTPEASAAFAKTRQQYGNMLELQKLAQNGAEGDVSIARIANMKNIGNKDLQELADISAQFLKPREGMHGAAQRAAAGIGVGSLAGLPALAGMTGGGRAMNSAMNSQTARNMLLNAGYPALPPELEKLLYRSAPVLGSQ